jgi:hypothetical protein
MTHLHVVPTADRLELHQLAGCPCQPRQREIRRDSDTVDLIHLHRSLDEDELQPTAA